MPVPSAAGKGLGAEGRGRLLRWGAGVPSPSCPSVQRLPGGFRTLSRTLRWPRGTLPLKQVVSPTACLRVGNGQDWTPLLSPRDAGVWSPPLPCPRPCQERAGRAQCWGDRAQPSRSGRPVGGQRVRGRPVRGRCLRGSGAWSEPEGPWRRRAQRLRGNPEDPAAHARENLASPARPPLPCLSLLLRLFRSSGQERSQSPLSILRRTLERRGVQSSC